MKKSIFRALLIIIGFAFSVCFVTSCSEEETYSDSSQVDFSTQGGVIVRNKTSYLITTWCAVDNETYETWTLPSRVTKYIAIGESSPTLVIPANKEYHLEYVKNGLTYQSLKFTVLAGKATVIDLY